MNAGFLEAFIQLGYLNREGEPRDAEFPPR
jgi:hypothetical protein